MKIIVKYTQLTLVLFFFSMNAGCVNGLERSLSDVALSYRLAINEKDITSLIALSELPLTFVEQEWVTADDGYGFVLGKKNISQFTQLKDFETHLNSIVNTIEITGKNVSHIPKSDYSVFKDELKGTEEHWNKLQIYLFKRGEGDVEHIVLFGINTTNQKIQAIYIN